LAEVKMKILIDIGHPAHVHLFKNFAREMLTKGHKILFTCRQKEFEIELLKHYGYDYKSFGKKYSSLGGKAVGLIKFDLMEFLEGLKFRPDLFLSHGSIYAAHASFLLKKPHICFEDTFNMEQIRLYKPFTDIILTPDYDNTLTGKKVIKYAGFHELAYLPPEVYQPEDFKHEELNLNDNEKYVLLRFISWQATHDAGSSGISLNDKIKIVNEFGKYARVFISSEKELPAELKTYQIKITPEKIHSIISCSSLVFSEGATMVAEGCMLGIPSIYISKRGTSYTDYLENKFGIICNYNGLNYNINRAIEKGVEILQSSDIREEWKAKRLTMLKSKINVTSFLIWFITNYPDSTAVLKDNPEYSNTFLTK
jgi:uncharacterized protein